MRNMSQQRKLSRHNSKQSSIGETASVGSTKSGKSNGSSEYCLSLGNGQVNGKKTNGLSKHGSQESNGDSASSQTASSQHATASILNVAEMLLHGVADNEIINIWLNSIQCDEFVAKFIDAGYDMPTLSRITPQDLTAIGVTDPVKRSKILTEIKKLNLQDGIPNFIPTSLSHWLSLIRLDSYYHKSLCDQNVDTIEKLCQLTWEDFEELGISKLGHQKRFQLAIERVKELKENSKNLASKPMSEPIYDTNPSQILLVASAENHSVNGPIINKQSSTGELSSTGSGSMHSVYSAASAHYQPTYAPVADSQSNQMPNMMTSNQQQPQPQHQAIYSQLPNQLAYQQQPHPIQISPGAPSHHHQQQPQQQQQQQQPSHYQPFQLNQHLVHQQQQQSPANQFSNASSNLALNQSNRQSLGQLPFSALSKLTKHQQQMLQQSSIYATLSRQPQRAKQPPPPVPIRTNSLKSDSLTDDPQQDCYAQFNGGNSNTLRLAGGRMIQARGQFNSHTMLSKNKSFSGNAHMEASRAKFLNRNSQQMPQQMPNLPQQIRSLMNAQFNGNSGQDYNIYGAPQASDDTIPGQGSCMPNGQTNHRESMFNVQSMPNNAGMMGHPMPNQSQQLSKSQLDNTDRFENHFPSHDGLGFDLTSDTNSTKSLILPASNMVTSSMDNRTLANSNHDSSSSSQTLYNSASSGSGGVDSNHDPHNLASNFNPSLESGDMIRRSMVATESSSTLNDATLTLDQHSQPQPPKQLHFQAQHFQQQQQQQQQCNATTGKDDEFPPPPSPLTQTDFDEQTDLVSINSDNNFTDVNHGLMTFRVGT